MEHWRKLKTFNSCQHNEMVYRNYLEPSPTFMSQAEHDKVLASAVKEVLLPLGFRRKGRSRLYFSDEGIWSCIVEFQPSSFSKGSYLNVAAHWLWTTSDHISFDYGGRIGGFARFDNPEKWCETSQRLAFSAAQAVQELREQFRSLHDIARALTGVACNSKHSGWEAFHAAVISGLAGDAATAYRLFVRVGHTNASSETMRVLKLEALRLAQATHTKNLFRQIILERVSASRLRLGMSGDILLPPS